MKIAVIQFKPKFLDKDFNVRKMAKIVSENEAEIIVFPELCTSGYFFISKSEIQSIAEPVNGRTMNLFQELSFKQNKIIIFGFVETSGKMLFNSAAIIFPNSNLSRVYRKTHLFYKEKFYFEQGDTGFFVINDVEREINIGCMICYDWRFPESARSLALLGADLIVCPSNLITNVWHIAMPARALENKVYLAVANRFGTESREGEELVFKGNSAIWDYNGNILAKAEDKGDFVLFSEIEPKNTRNKKFNQYNDIFIDRRPDLYI